MKYFNGKFDFILHSIGMSPNVRKDIPYDDINYDYFLKTIDISALSFHKVLQVCSKLDAINEWGSVVALSYVAAQRTLYGYNDMGQIVAAVFRNFDLRPDPEITIEINPGTASIEQLTGYRQAGANRINIGVQSFQKKNLDFLGRIHTADQARKAISDARRAGFQSIGLDFIYGLPGQTEADWSKDLQQAVEHDCTHLSCYMLSYENETPLQSDLDSGRIQPLAEEDVRALFDATIDFLADHQYFQYEISNFARIGKDGKPCVSRHNLKYWTRVPYIGLGPSAHSFVEPQRSWNVASVAEYIAVIESGRLPLDEREVLTQEQQMIEFVYLGLRMTRGIDLTAFKKKFHIDFVDAYKELISDLKKRNYITVSNDYCALTRQGRAFLDGISAMFVGTGFKAPSSSATERGDGFQSNP